MTTPCKNNNFPYITNPFGSYGDVKNLYSICYLEGTASTFKYQMYHLTVTIVKN